MVGIPALGFVFVMFIVVFQDRDMVYTGRIYRAESDIRAIETVIALYKEKYGLDPSE